MGSDIWYVIRFWAVLFLVGSAAFPLTRRLFSAWFDRGYLFSKSIGLVVVTWVVYALGTARLVPFSIASIVLGLVVLFAIGVLANFQFSIYNLQSIFKFSHFAKASRDKRVFVSWSLIVIEEVFFLIALIFWAWIKGHEPSIRGLEKFMDFGFTQSILSHPYFPTPDMWYAGSSVNYYYFGHIAMAIITKVSGIDLAITFNLMLASIFAFTLTMSFSIGYQLTQARRFIAAILTAFLVTLAGNMQTIYAFTKGYTGDAVKPFWQLLWPLAQFWEKLPQGLNTYWYANATRFIPFSIHEFPSYSFVVSDVHGHVLSLPFVLLAIALLIEMFATKDPSESARDPATKRVDPLRRSYSEASRINTTFLHRSLARIHVGFYGFLVGALLMTNALDGPIYLGLFIVLFFVFFRPEVKNWRIPGKVLGILGVAAVVSSLPFVMHFSSFVHGVAINCPPVFLANSKLGPFLFEGVEKCQKSPLWMMALLWGFFIYCGGWLVVKTYSFRKSPVEKVLIVFFLFSVGLIIFPEFFYFKDIYPAHFRSNTMFKLGYQAFILFSIMSAYTIIHLSALKTWAYKRLFFILLTPLIFFVSIYPLFSVRSYFDSLRTYHGLYGLEWLQNEYSDDFKTIEFLKMRAQSACGAKGIIGTMIKNCAKRPVIVEADGDSYTDYNHFSAFSGYQTIVGWAVHEWLWRGSYDEVAPRREEVRRIYEDRDIPGTKELLSKYDVTYVIVGSLERQKFKNLQELKLSQLGPEVFRSGNTVVYDVGL
jgi:YYY domain-containing protein